jgi:hypothetical protein
MSDAYYQEQARRRTRNLIIVIALIAVIACGAFALISLFRDACTGSFDRTPWAVVSAYVEAVARDDLSSAQACWEHETFYELEAGCSEICLSKAAGAGYEVVEIAVAEPVTTPEGRANLAATVTIACPGGAATHSGEMLLDSVGADVPWKHWAIIHSTIGGTIAEPWCQ